MTVRSGKTLTDARLTPETHPASKHESEHGGFMNHVYIAGTGTTQFGRPHAGGCLENDTAILAK